MNPTAITQLVPTLAPFLKDTNHIDIKTIQSDLPMRQFIAGMLSYYPGWLKFLYSVRWAFVRLLGMRQQGVPQMGKLQAEDISLTPGDKSLFFTVTMAEDEKYYVAEASESHLTAYLGVVVEERRHGRYFHVITIVRYHKWTGPVYFNTIRPFHHVVVSQMMKAGAGAGYRAG